MLNPNLYALLEKRFGSGAVKIANENCEMSAAYVIDPTQEAQDLRYRLKHDSPGEEYIVRCPFCNDWNYRLYINHRWGVYDERTRSRNLWLAHCWNEECLSSFDNQLSLYEQVVELHQAGVTDWQTMPRVKQAGELSKRKPRKIELPGGMWRLDDMVSRSPRHDALAYVESRLWDPTYLGKRYGVGFCLDSFYEQARNRIIAPIYKDGKLVGWQARYLGDPPKGMSKWWTCPGCPIGSYLYNYDEMKAHQTKVITEGPADVWGFGPQACAVFTKSMSDKQRKLLVDCTEPEDVIVILLDPEQDPVAKAKRAPHHIEKLYSELNREPKLAGRVIKVYLPDGNDPAEMDREYMRALIRLEADKQGLHVGFGKPKVRVHANN